MVDLVGKSVRCVWDTAAPEIKRGDIYEISSCDRYYYNLVGLTVSFSFSCKRFVSALGVVCIDTFGLIPSLLQYDSQYMVEEYIPDVHEYVLEGMRDAGSFKVGRFEQIWEKSEIVIPTTIKTSSDPEEERLWKLMRPRLDVGHCSCGIHKNDCRYHS
jgi:hypothetical protein